MVATQRVSQKRMAAVGSGGGVAGGYGLNLPSKLQSSSSRRLSRAVEVIHGRTKAAAGAWVCGEDARHDGVEVLPVFAEPVVVEVERGGAPEVAPPGGEDLRAGAFLGGQERDDVLEDAVRKVADTVGGASIRYGQRRLRAAAGASLFPIRSVQRRLLMLHSGSKIGRR